MNEIVYSAKLFMTSANKYFSHIYIERRAFGYTITNDVLLRFPGAIKIPIRHYKDVFNRPRQDFQFQKISRKLILAVKEPPYLLEGSERCYSDPGKPLYYATPAINCLYDCDYCFLQGMYPSANIVMFVNTESFLQNAEHAAAEKPINLSISYETDLAALNPIISLCGKWIAWASTQKNICLEIRTKSGSARWFSDNTSNPQTILAWSLLPQNLIERYETKSPSLTQRLEAVKIAAGQNWRVRLCLDPVICCYDWERLYRKLVEKIFQAVPSEKIEDVHIGVFRINADYLKIMRKQRQDTDILFQPYEQSGKTVSYSIQKRGSIIQYISELLAAYIPTEKIFHAG